MCMRQKCKYLLEVVIIPPDSFSYKINVHGGFRTQIPNGHADQKLL